jgi:poly(A) polymerase
MIKKLIGRIFGSKTAEPAPPDVVPRMPRGKRVEIPAAEHGIDATLLDDRAVKVVSTLKEAGHEAYIVGGAVRDLLVGRRPKDFDVATNATPEQVKSLFRRAFIVGRRFRIVHVVFGRGREHEVVEVSTFRAWLDAASADQVEGSEKTSKGELAGKSHVVDASGRVLRDNVWGPQIEDAARRDFTVNAMYYDPLSRVVVDYHGGLGDVRARVLRMIGDAASRYREDPVRLVRAVRFAAKLGFEIEPKTRAPMAAALELLENVPPSRLFDEMIKLMQTGHAIASVEALDRHGMTRAFPVLNAAFGADAALDERAQRFVRLALEDTDRRVDEGRAVAPSFMLACLLWHEVAQRWQRSRAAGTHVVPALQEAIDTVFDARIGDVSGRGKLGTDMREIWMMQPRFERRSGNAPFGLVEQPRYRAGYDFLRLRADAGEADPELADWWEDFALGSNDERDALLATLREQHGPRRVRGGARAPAAAEHAPAAGDAVGDATADAVADPASDSTLRTRTVRAPHNVDSGAHPPSEAPEPAAEGDAPRRRRRRRRKPKTDDAGDRDGHEVAPSN